MAYLLHLFLLQHLAVFLPLFPLSLIKNQNVLLLVMSYPHLPLGVFVVSFCSELGRKDAYTETYVPVLACHPLSLPFSQLNHFFPPLSLCMHLLVLSLVWHCCQAHLRELWWMPLVSAGPGQPEESDVHG